MKVCCLSLVFLLLGGGAAAQIDDLLISEYVEGSSYNKALEIFNGTDDPIALGNYAIERYSNGSTVPVTSALPAVILAPDDVFVLVNPSAVSALLSLADATDDNLNFDGNDAVVLTRGGQAIDCIGQVGYDPGTAWTCSDGATINTTMEREIGACVGDTDPSNFFNPCRDFDFLPSDTFSGLGSHEADCSSVANRDPSWDALKSYFR